MEALRTWARRNSKEAMTKPEHPLNRKLVLPLAEPAPFNRRCYTWCKEAVHESAGFVAKALWIPLLLSLGLAVWSILDTQTPGVTWLDAYPRFAELALIVSPWCLGIRALWRLLCR